MDSSQVTVKGEYNSDYKEWDQDYGWYETGYTPKIKEITNLLGTPGKYHTETKKEGLSTSFYLSGQKSIEGNYRNDLKEGVWTSWSPNYRDSSKVNYVNGKPNGQWIEWYENGQKSSKVIFVDGEENYKWTNWYDNGNLKLKGTDKNGKRWTINSMKMDKRVMKKVKGRKLDD